MADAPIVLDVRSIKELSDSSTTWRIDPNAVGYGFNEDRNYRIRKPTEGDRLLIDDEAVETDDGEWVWSPGFYAGQVRAELLGPDDRVRTTYLLDVSPHPDKLGGDIFQSMLDQIWEFDPSLVLGTEPATLPIGHDPRIEDPWLEYARLRSEGDNFVRALSAIVSHPLRDLRAERALLPLQYVRRADRQTALAALRNAGLLTVLAPGDSSATPITALPPFDVPVARETLDSAGNRCIAAIAYAVSRRAVRLREKLQLAVEGESESDTRTALVPRWPRRRDFLDRIVRQLRQLQRVSPLADVTRREISAAGLNAVSADPAYSNAYGSGWRILRNGVEGPPDAERLWISPTWEIYERWCFVRLGNAIRTLKREYDWSISRNHKSGATAAFTASKGGKACIELLLQPTFPAHDRHSNAGFRSISRQREPDIVLTWTDPVRAVKWAVLDAKYRTGRPNVLHAMSSAHIYRDALRWHEKRPERALLLVPRAGGASWLEQPDFIRRHCVGVCALSTETDPERVFRSLFSEDTSGQLSVTHER